MLLLLPGSSANDTRVFFLGGLDPQGMMPLRSVYELIGRSRWARLPHRLPVDVGGDGQTFVPISHDYCDGTRLFYERPGVIDGIGS